MPPRTALQPLDERQRRGHKLRNALHTVLLLGGMTALLAGCAWLLAGAEGLLWAALGAVMILLFSPRLSPRWLLAMYGAREIGPQALPQVHDTLRAIARRAELPRVPKLYYVPNSMLSAFTVGSPDEATIGITDGALRVLSLRELAGVVAHEISHIRNRDLWVMGLADTISQVTRIMAFAGLILLIVMLPVWLTAYGTVPWLAILLLAAAPTIGSLLQLALSRAREFEADLDAAGLTGDPLGLAAALEKMERYQGSMWEKILLPGRRIPDPSLLRTHPSTEDRIRRLLSLLPERDVEPFRTAEAVHIPHAYPPVQGRPRQRISGLWY